MMKDRKKDFLTIPNLLSLFRLILIPTYVLIYRNASVAKDYYIAGSILAASCLTDWIDGKIARRFNAVTTAGKILDPLADKATQFAMISCLVSKYPVLWFTVSLFILKESFQLVAGLLALRQGKILTGALLSGKLCTAVLFLSLILMVILPELEYGRVVIISLIDCIFMLIALGNYVHIYSSQHAMIEQFHSEEA